MTKATKKLRETGLSQPELARRLGVSQGAVSRLLAGDRGGSGETRAAAWREFGIAPTDWDEGPEDMLPQEVV
jgi:predicted transcriptional regulator